LDIPASNLGLIFPAFIKIYILIEKVEPWALQQARVQADAKKRMHPRTAKKEVGVDLHQVITDRMNQRIAIFNPVTPSTSHYNNI